MVDKHIHIRSSYGENSILFTEYDANILHLYRINICDSEILINHLVDIKCLVRLLCLEMMLQKQSSVVAATKQWKYHRHVRWMKNLSFIQL